MGLMMALEVFKGFVSIGTLGVGSSGGKVEGINGDIGGLKEFGGAWGGFLYGTKGFRGDI